MVPEGGRGESPVFCRVSAHEALALLPGAFVHDVDPMRGQFWQFAYNGNKTIKEKRSKKKSAKQGACATPSATK